MARSKVIYSIIILGLGLRLAWVFVLPPFAGPDEQSHYDYIEYLAENKELPVDIYQDSHHEYFQSPLYYLALTPFYALAGKWFPGFRLCLLRLINLFIAAVILWLSSVILGNTFSGSGAESLIAGSMAFVAWHPIYARNSICISNDNLAALIGAMLLYLLMNRGPVPKPLLKYAAMGLLWGLGILTKTSLLAIAPVILYAAMSEGEPGTLKNKGLKAGAYFLAAALTALLTTGFWLIHNQALYGNLMGMGAYWPRPEDPLSTAFQAASFKHAWVSFWRSFGPGSEPVVWNVFKYVWLTFTAWAFAGWGRWLFEKNRRILFDLHPGLLLNVVYFLSFCAAGWLFGVRYGKGFHGYFDGRLLFAAMIPAGSSFAWGLENAVPGFLKKYAWPAWSLLLLINAGLLLLI